MTEKETIIGIILLGISIGALIFSLSGFWTTVAETPEVTQSLSTQKTSTAPLEKSNIRSSSGEVSVDLEPEKFEAGKFYVKMSVNTHTINTLNEYDLRKITALRYNGKEYNPIESSPLQGHHNAGKLVFVMEEEPKAFSISITNLYDKGIREFTWP